MWPGQTFFVCTWLSAVLGGRFHICGTKRRHNFQHMDKIAKLPAADCFGTHFTACGPYIWKGWQHIMFDSCTLVVPNVKNVIAAKIFSFYQLIFFRGSPCTALASSTCVACTCCHDLFLPRQELNFSFPPEFLLHLQAGKLAWCWLLFTTRTYLTICPKKGSLKKSQALEIENQRWQMKRCDSWKPRQIDFHLVFVKIWHPFFIFIFG